MIFIFNDPCRLFVNLNSLNVKERIDIKQPAKKPTNHLRFKLAEVF